MRTYVIGNDGITLCREPLATVTEGEIAVTSKEELQAAPLSGKRLLALWAVSERQCRLSATCGSAGACRSRSTSGIRRAAVVWSPPQCRFSLQGSASATDFLSGLAEGQFSGQLGSHLTPRWRRDGFEPLVPRKERERFSNCRRLAFHARGLRDTPRRPR
jgi:hypothetical protein